MARLYLSLTMTPALAAAALLLPATPARADVDQLPPVEVLGQADDTTVRTGEVIEQETTGFASHIGKPELQRGGLSLGELIDRQAGAQVRESGGFGGYSEISLRGAGSEQVMVYLDGLLLNDGAGGGFDFSTLDMSQLAAVDIYRGSTPQQLGKASFGGAVNLRTLQQSDASKFRLSSTLGDFGTQKISSQISGTRGQLDGLLALGYARSDNDFEFLNDNGTQYNPDDDETQKRHNAAVDQRSALLKSGWRISTDNRLDASLQVFDKEQEIPDWNNHPAAAATFANRNWQIRTKLTADRFLSPAVNSATEIHLSKKKETYDDRGNSVGLGAQYDRNTTTTQGLKSYLEWVGENATSGVNLSLREEQYTRDDLLEQHSADESRRLSASLGLQSNLFFAEEKWLLSPSFRYQWFRTRYRPDETSALERNTEAFGKPQLGLKYRWSDALTFKSNLGAYIREPGFYELYGDRGLFLGNSELKPEQGRNIDIGAEWAKQRPFASVAFARLQTSLWHNEIDDMITRTYDARGIGKSQNIAAARLRGAELSLLVELINGIEVSTSLTLQDPENRSGNAAFRGKTLPGRAGESFFASLSIPLENWTLLYELDIQQERFYDSANLLPAKDKQLHNLKISRDFGRKFHFALELKNIGDQAVEDFNGYPKPGRAWYLSLSYNH
ncbi:MAG: TonB-dependent receptor [Gammaproteobacteria bacterium]|nr:TonB-dependent receptor [Gammaproteobacteria bacterium]